MRMIRSPDPLLLVTYSAPSGPCRTERRRPYFWSRRTSLGTTVVPLTTNRRRSCSFNVAMKSDPDQAPHCGPLTNVAPLVAYVAEPDVQIGSTKPLAVPPVPS